MKKAKNDTDKREQARLFSELLKDRADDALGLCATAITMKDLEHHYGVLMGIDWCASAFRSATGHLFERPKWMEMCGVDTRQIDDVVTATTARILAANG